MEKPNITAILREAESHGVPYDPESTTFFLSREELLPGRAPICRRCGAAHSCRWRAARRSSRTTTDCRRTGCRDRHAPGDLGGDPGFERPTPSARDDEHIGAARANSPTVTTPAI
jgi:hypothetical protein